MPAKSRLGAWGVTAKPYGTFSPKPAAAVARDSVLTFRASERLYSVTASEHLVSVRHRGPK